MRSDRPVAEIAVRCGFPTLSNFHEQFTRRTGESPRRYRNRTAAQGLPDAGNPGAAR
ncbi:MAG: helix-turn-helix domain-containing protein [Betaproteobacteria bacterium]